LNGENFGPSATTPVTTDLIQVSNVPESADAESVLMLFGNEQLSGGGTVVTVNKFGDDYVIRYSVAKGCTES
jgi:hypothetical protein